MKPPSALRHSFPFATAMALVFTATQLHAATNYTGATDSWTTAGNWSGGVVPTVAFNQRININTGTTVTFGAAQGTVTIGSSTAGETRALALAAASAGTATLNITGGVLQAKATAGPTGLSLVGGNVSGSIGILNISGGTLDLTPSDSYNGRVLSIGLGNNNANVIAGTVTLSGTGTLKVGDFRFNENDTPQSTGSITGTLNLNSGGTLETGAIKEGASGNAQGTTNSTVNFDGGILKANAASTAFMTNLNAANVKSNGAKIDTNNFNITIAQNLLDGTGGGGLTKSGAGTLTLTGTGNTYTGASIVKAGTLKLNASTTLSTSSSLVAGDTGSSGAVLDVTTGGLTLGATQTLAGIGTVLATGQTLTSSGTISAGDSSINTLTIDGGSLVLDSTSKFVFTLGTSSDLVSLLNSVALSGNNTLDFADFTFTAGTGFGNGVYTLIDNAGSITNLLNSSGLSGTIGAYTATLNTSTLSGNDLILTVIPEPNVAALLGGLGTLMLLRRRRH